MIIVKVMFWVSALVVGYTYVIYPTILFLAYALSQIGSDWQYLVGRRNRRCSLLPPQELPAVSVIIPAFNEEQALPEKIRNVRAIDYPPEKLQVIFVSDASNDSTNEILGGLTDANVTVIYLAKRSGKPAALNAAAAVAKHGIYVFSDATTLFAPDALQKLVRHFSDPQVGVVCGMEQVQGSGESLQTERLFWMYESILRLMESRLGASLTASGAIYAIRKECYRSVAVDAVIDDFVIPMTARRLGYTVLYDPEAVALESYASCISAEFKRRVRLAIGSFRNLGTLMVVPVTAFTRIALFSHKILRWMVPFFLVGLLITNVLMFYQGWVYQSLLVVQAIFYFWALLGLCLRRFMQRLPYGLFGYFLLAMNLAFLVGFVRFLVGRREVTWERAR